MTYHVPTARPYCWLDPETHDPRTLPVRVDWAADGAAACADHTDEAASIFALKYTPTCDGCSRKHRAELIRNKVIQEHKSGRKPKEAACQ